MAKILKPLLLVMLLLSAVALGLGIWLFAKREVLKGRTQKLEQTALKIAKNLRYDKITADQIKANTKAELANIEKPLGDLATQAEVTYGDLQTNIKDLASTKDVLDKTKTELATTKGELAATQTKVTELTETVSKKDTEIAEKGTKITQLEADKTKLTGDVDDLNKKVEKVAGDLVAAKQTIEERDKKIRYQGALLGEKFPIPKGLKGKVLAVNKDYHFVVLDIGIDDGLLPNVEMLIHRDNQLIGRVRIGMVLKHVAIGDVIVTDWKAPTVVKEDDHVLF
ncbi:MAG: hypothetical protein NTV49_06265 [Kiritimatiellaeota bacterium]|nr:hypothetical protein [Kiritimatiellota bacterium]